MIDCFYSLRNQVSRVIGTGTSGKQISVSCPLGYRVRPIWRLPNKKSGARSRARQPMFVDLERRTTVDSARTSERPKRAAQETRQLATTPLYSHCLPSLWIPKNNLRHGAHRVANNKRKTCDSDNSQSCSLTNKYQLALVSKGPAE